MKAKHLTLLCLALVCFSCQNKKKKNNQVKELSDSTVIQKVSLRQEWSPNSNYCGVIFAKNKFAEPNKIEIDIVPGAENIDPVKMVISGQNDFGDAGADRVLEAIDKGADLVIIGVVNVNSPTCFLSKKEKNIKTPLDFQNHSVGILTGTSTEYIYRTIVKKLKLNPSKIKEKEVPFGLQTFLLDEYDVRPAFIYDEPVSLDMQNVKYNIIEPKDYGVSFLGTVYFTTKELIEKKPDLVQSFINSIADGWSATLTYPEAAIELLKKYDKTLDEKRELKSLLKGKDYYQGKDNKILWADLSDWQGMVKNLQELGKIKTIKLENCINNSFLENYYKSKEIKNGSKL
ncbi:MAG: ABC transporter substrate-binding protein [Bacteroidetes bacterium]|nr:ABC transporter substrate-binding protein [Bacteroidota bacterium]